MISGFARNTSIFRVLKNILRKVSERRQNRSTNACAGHWRLILCQLTHQAGAASPVVGILGLVQFLVEPDNVRGS